MHTANRLKPRLERGTVHEHECRGNLAGAIPCTSVDVRGLPKLVLHPRVDFIVRVGVATNEHVEVVRAVRPQARSLCSCVPGDRHAGVSSQRSVIDRHTSIHHVGDWEVVLLVGQRGVADVDVARLVKGVASTTKEDLGVRPEIKVTGFRGNTVAVVIAVDLYQLVDAE